MNIIHATLLGIVEGITEFLPISSTAHLILASKYLGIRQTDFAKFFEVFIQSGAILAVIAIYGRNIIKDKTLLKYIGISFLPTALIGFILYKAIKTIFFSSYLMISASLLFVGILFIITEILVMKKTLVLSRSIHSITLFDAILVGLLQSLAVIPGVSRSGIVMLALMWRGYKREDSAKYSFLLAVPTIFAASGYDLFKMRKVVFSSLQYAPLILVGFIASFISAYIVIRWFITYLQKNNLIPFAIYRIIAGIVF